MWISWDLTIENVDLTEKTWHGGMIWEYSRICGNDWRSKPWCPSVHATIAGKWGFTPPTGLNLANGDRVWTFCTSMAVKRSVIFCPCRSHKLPP